VNANLYKHKQQGYAVVWLSDSNGYEGLDGKYTLEDDVLRDGDGDVVDMRLQAYQATQSEIDIDPSQHRATQLGAAKAIAESIEHAPPQCSIDETENAITSNGDFDFAEECVPTSPNLPQHTKSSKRAARTPATGTSVEALLPACTRAEAESWYHRMCVHTNWTHLCLHRHQGPDASKIDLLENQLLAYKQACREVVLAMSQVSFAKPNCAPQMSVLQAKANNTPCSEELQQADAARLVLLRQLAPAANAARCTNEQPPPQELSSEWTGEAMAALESVFGLVSLKPFQVQAINGTLSGRNVVIDQATGSSYEPANVADILLL